VILDGLRTALFCNFRSEYISVVVLPGIGAYMKQIEINRLTLWFL
jgi:hypothetical protein